MKRYIEVNALMEYCSNQKSKTISNNDIARFPTADVVEVVRCKDCRSGCPEIMNYNGMVEVYYYCNGDGFYHSGNNYCSDGERRE